MSSHSISLFLRPCFISDIVTSGLSFPSYRLPSFSFPVVLLSFCSTSPAPSACSVCLAAASYYSFTFLAYSSSFFFDWLNMKFISISLFYFTLPTEAFVSTSTVAS